MKRFVQSLSASRRAHPWAWRGGFAALGLSTAWAVHRQTHNSSQKKTNRESWYKGMRAPYMR